MSWLNLNQSLNSLKGQITNFASEVLSEGPEQEAGDVNTLSDSAYKELEQKCKTQESEIAALKRLNTELEATLQSERASRKNGVKDKEDEGSWYWDPPAPKTDHQYEQQIQLLQQQLSDLKEKEILEREQELLKLRDENKNLTTNLEDLDNQHQTAMERLLTLKKELQKNFEVLKQEHADLKATNDEYSQEIETLLKKIGDRDKEIQNLQTRHGEYETLHHKYLNLEKVHSLLRENAEKFQEENQELHEEVFKLQEQVTKLEHDLELATKNSKVVPKESFDEVLKELNDLKGKRFSEVHMDEVNIDDNAKSVIENLKRDINDLKHKLSLNEEIDDHRYIKTDKIMQLYNKYVSFDLPVDYIGEMPSTEDKIVFFKLESVFKTLNSFKEDIDALENSLSEKNHTLNHMQSQIEEMQGENDLLTSDFDQVERELREMKKNNDFLISEIAALKNTSKLQPIIESHEDNLVKLESELEDSNKINKTFESEIKRIENELNEVRSEKDSLQESLRDLKSKYTSMLSELETYKTQTKVVEELESTANLEYSKKIKLANDDIDELKKKLHAANAKNEQLSIDIHIIENDKVLFTKQIEDLKHELEAKNSALKDLEAMNNSLEIKLQEFDDKMDDLIQKRIAAELETTLNKSETSNTTTSVNVVDSTEMDKLITENRNLSIKLEEVTADNTTKINTIHNLTAELNKLKLDYENKVKCNESEDTIRTLQENIDALKSKIVNQEALQNEILILKGENQKMIEKKLEIEAELLKTDSKIVHLDEEFEKLVSDLNEKDNIIDSLNSTVTENNELITQLQSKLTEFEIHLNNKTVELSNQTKIFKDTEDKLIDLTHRSDRSYDEMTKLTIEKEELHKQLLAINEEIQAKNTAISKLTAYIEEVEANNTEYKNEIGHKETDIRELNQKISNLNDKVQYLENLTNHEEDYTKLVQEKDLMEQELTDLRNNLSTTENELIDLKKQHDDLIKDNEVLQNSLEVANKEKLELINLVNLKHNESLQYHNEIQRLNNVLLEQTNEYKKAIQEKENQPKQKYCMSCENLRMTLKEKDEIILTLNVSAQEYEKLKQELNKSSDTIKSLTERCSNLDKSLAIQLENMKALTAEKIKLSEQDLNSTRELDRLRRHLVETEENYTQELMTSEQKLNECVARLTQVEERAKQTNTVYTSNSIRANQEVETLRNQIRLLERQREELHEKLSSAADARERSDAASTNLQVVLEQFQLDKERDIHAATEKIRNKMEDLKRENLSLQGEITKLNAKLEEALAGLQAASRLGDQVETKSAQINDLKEQVRTLQQSVTAAEERYYNAISNQQDKVDKKLVKNLVVNYILTAAQNATNKTQVLRILSTVLDFNHEECSKLGLVKSAPQDSLAAEFVKFLQSESQPRHLPDIRGISAPSAPTVPRSTPPPSHKRNPSTGSNNLLFQNLDSIETSSQISLESENNRTLETGINQTRNNEGAILKSVLKDM